MKGGVALTILRRLDPSDLGLEYEELRFDVRDEASGEPLSISAWWIGSKGAERTMLIIHGYGDSKIGGIAWAPLFHEMGWNILAIDLRAHGESGGVYSTAGFWERHDLNQVINRIRAERVRETRVVILFGVSLGAAVALAASVSRDDLAGLILEGPYATFADAVTGHGRLYGAPGGWMQRLAMRIAQWISRADFDAVRPVDLIPEAPCPVMIVHAAEDSFMVSGESEALQAALARRNNPRDVFWEVASAGHVLCLACEPLVYREKIEAFLQRLALGSGMGVS